MRWIEVLARSLGPGLQVPAQVQVQVPVQVLRIQSCTCRDTQKTCRFCTRLWPHTRLASVQRFNARVHAARAASPPSTYRSYNEVRRDADGVEAMQDRNAEFIGSFAENSARIALLRATQSPMGSANWVGHGM